MLKGEDFDETPAENLLAFSRKNRQQFAGYTNDGTGVDSKTNVLLHSSEAIYEQVTKQDASGSECVLLVGSGVVTLRMINLNTRNMLE